MKTTEFKLAGPVLYNFGLGHCQVTYISKNDLNQKLIYCLQYQGKNWFPAVRLMRCSLDGEPCHEVSFKNIRILFERPKSDGYVEQAVNQWIDQYEKQVGLK